jgi:hypothetical protein
MPSSKPVFLTWEAVRSRVGEEKAKRVLGSSL